MKLTKIRHGDAVATQTRTTFFVILKPSDIHIRILYPLFSQAYKSLQPQALSFHIHTKRRECHPEPILARRPRVSKMPAMSSFQISAATMLRSCAAGISLLTLAATSGLSFAQTTASEQRSTITVSGIVRDPGGNPIEGATVLLEEKATKGSIETKAKDDGTFSFLASRAGTYVVRARMQGFREGAIAPMELSLGEKKQVELVLQVGFAGGVMVEPAKPITSSGSKSGDMEISDKPSFSVAGVTDWTNVGGHGSDTKLRTSESLARETLALKSGEHGEASASATDAARAADSHRLLGERAERSGDPVAAEHEYEEAVRLNPSEQNYFAWGTELLLHRAIKPAAEVFTKGTTAHPESARMLAGLGAALYASGSYDDAASRLCAAADLQPADPAPYLFLGKMEKSAPDPLPCAEQKLARFAHDQPTNALANYYYSVSLWKRGRGTENSANLQQVKKLLQKAVAADPKLSEAFVQLGAVYAAEGNPQQAITAYKKAIEVNPQSGEAHYRLALAYKRAGDQEKSEQELQLYKQADKSETAAIEQQRREIRQFLIILKDQPQASTPQPEKQK
jgi:tetratricopeptide (TPR) repeat protein